MESIANPGGIITDLDAVSAIAKEAGVPLIVDNTLATPYLTRPIEHGADIIVHSLTKFLGGHGNSIGGAIVDCGTFDWMKSGRYPTMSRALALPITASLSQRPSAISASPSQRAYSSLRDLGPAISPVQCLPYPHWHRDAAAPVAAPLRQRAGGGRVAFRPPKGRVGELRWAAR